MKDVRKITKVELAILVVMLLSFVASLIFLAADSRNYALIFFVLHAVLTCVYFIISQDRFTQAFFEQEEGAGVLSKAGLEEKDAVIDSLQKEKNKLTEDKSRIEHDLNSAVEENKELARRLAQSQKEKNERPAEQNALLPENEQIKRCDLIAIIKDMFDKYEVQCLESGIRLELATTFQMVNMQCDERYVRIMLDNIIENSMKYMDQNGNFLITISDIGEEGIFMVCKDNGAGLPSDEASRVFDLNYRGSNHKGGNGLGLTQVRTIVEHYKGKVYAKCELNEGMAIYVQFPVESKG